MRPHASTAATARSHALRNASSITLAALILVGCSGRSSGEAPPTPEPLAECEAYAASMRACVAQLGPAAAHLADSHATFVTQSGTGAANDVARAQIRENCIAATKQLATVCR